jgi:hypothetical protein
MKSRYLRPKATAFPLRCSGKTVAAAAWARTPAIPRHSAPGEQFFRCRCVAGRTRGPGFLRHGDVLFEQLSAFAAFKVIKWHNYFPENINSILPYSPQMRILHTSSSENRAPHFPEKRPAAFHKPTPFRSPLPKYHFPSFAHPGQRRISARLNQILQ